MALRTVKRAFGALLVLFALGWHPTVPAQPCEPVVGGFVSIEGTVELQRAGAAGWEPASLNAPLCQQDTLRAGRHSRAAIALINDAILRLDEGTTLRLVNISGVAEEPSLLDIVRGAIKSFSRKPRLIKVTSPYLNGAIEGTEFQLRVLNEAATLTVLEGLVRAENPQGGVLVAAGQAATATRGAAPELRTLVRPRDAVQWTLYYPPVFAALGGAASAAAEESPEFARGLTSAARGNVGDAIAELERTPESSRGSRFHAFRAALLLSVGRVQAATADIDRAIALAPDDGLAYAIRSVLDVVSNRHAEALADGQRAVDLSPSPAARVALSYAQQANFQLEAARENLLAAVETHPENALAWSRLGELQLMLGERRRASEAAATAKELAPDLARTQLVLGYAALAEFHKTEARAAFERAIELSSADPLAHLGLGLTEISQGRLAEGRQRIEVAVGLDSSSALLRAYLGKAYFEEKRGPLDSEQYAIAKSLDPLDPTAYLYDAIAKQTTNRPVEALEDIEASIERNDNRAVYRSRLLLDQDRAARGVSQARIVSDLGFSQVGINEATTSLSIDPGNAAAHRFLSDTYRDVRRREVARVSELLQAQMLQDVNINPVQPSVSETNLNVVTQGGPATAGYNEFTPLFERNRASALLSGVAGSNDTLGGEAVVSGVYDSFSVSAGLFRYDTEGWRANNDLRQEVDNIFAQWAVSPQFNVQAEYRRRESKEGDLAFNFDPDDFLSDQTIERDTETARVGLRFSPAPNSDVLVSYIHNDRTEDAESSRPDDLFGLAPFGIRIQEITSTDDKGEQFEGQYLWRGSQLNLITGLGHSEVDRDFSSILNALDPLGAFGPPGGVIPIDSENTKVSIDHSRGYLYANVDLYDSALWTIGVSYEDFEQDDFDQNGFYPKLGLRWQINEAVTLRVAAFKVMKPVLVSNRTLEPTQIAGFNQFFDDINATESKRYAGGVDWSISDQLKLGGELSFRYLDEPVFVGSDAVTEDREEVYHRVYAYWTPTSDLAVTSQLVYDLYKSDDGLATAFDNLPERVRTVSLPMGVTYFRPSGFFAGLVGTYVDQKVERAVTATQADGHDEFFVVDASLGYRLPKRRGTISLGVRNVFDTEFDYQDDSYREFRDEPSTGPYFPERTLLGQLTLSF